MNALVAMLCGFIAENFPDIQVMIFAGVPSLIWGAACLWVAGALKPFRLTARTIFSFCLSQAGSHPFCSRSDSRRSRNSESSRKTGLSVAFVVDGVGSRHERQGYGELGTALGASSQRTTALQCLSLSMQIERGGPRRLLCANESRWRDGPHHLRAIQRILS